MIFTEHIKSSLISIDKAKDVEFGEIREKYLNKKRHAQNCGRQIIHSAK